MLLLTSQSKKSMIIKDLKPRKSTSCPDTHSYQAEKQPEIRRDVQFEMKHILQWKYSILVHFDPDEWNQSRNRVGAAVKASGGLRAQATAGRTQPLASRLLTNFTRCPINRLRR
ncbi:Uncharacterized protein TCM_014533 [Theobroma cacao]|uniref:Uncharacterized protein n=1 Tax=Theobroma cacao TaxID=3641 RepID=A0A061FZ41_THECC|nr:Uncharacterized protein TCM_014533 [Theobroma cacao]